MIGRIFISGSIDQSVLIYLCTVLIYMSRPVHVLLFMYFIVNCILVVFDIFYYVCISPIMGGSNEINKIFIGSKYNLYKDVTGDI